VTADDERARKIAEAKARAEAARAARQGGQGAAAEPSASPPPADAPAEPAVPEVETTVISAAPAEPAAAAPAAAASAAPSPADAAADGADDRAARIAAAKARAEAARAAREGGAPAQPAAEAAAPPAAAAPAAAAESGDATAADERQRRIEEAKARAAAARAGASGGAAAAPAQPAATPAAAAPAAAAAAARPAAAAAPPAPMAPAEDWRGTATAPTRVLTARAEPRALMRRELRDVERRNLYTRRSMVRTSFWAALGVTLAGLALGFVNFFWPREISGFGSVVKIPASQVPPPGSDPKSFPEGQLYLVNLQPGEGVPPEFQSLAPPSESGGILALWRKCPHLGCTVPWRPEFSFEGVRGWFRCPCHGSTYTRAGIRVFGPAPRPMDTFAVTVNGDGSVDVDTSKVTLGATNNASRAVLA
jgi:cytochrome b6-f complex iron-sulfur subunit